MKSPPRAFLFRKWTSDDMAMQEAAVREKKQK
jgi:hypothetical protein